MEPTILSTIVWGVLWFFLGHLGTVIIVFVSGIIGGSIGHKKDNGLNDNTAVGVGGGLLIGYVLAILWEIWVIIQIIVHVVTLIQLIIAGA